MFGKSRPDPRTRESMILQCRVTLRKLELKYRTMLEREMRIARELKSKNLTSSSNVRKMKINYYMLREIEKTRARLREIQDTDEMNAAMNQLAGVLSAVHQLSDGIDPAEGRAAAGYIGKLNQKAAREEKRMSRILGRLEKKGGPMDREIPPEEKGDPVELPEDSAVKAELDEMNRYVEEMIKTL